MEPHACLPLLHGYPSRSRARAACVQTHEKLSKVKEREREKTKKKKKKMISPNAKRSISVVAAEDEVSDG